MNRKHEFLDDAELVERTKNGDGEAFSALYVRHRDAIYTYALHLLADDIEAQDTVQETFLRIHERLATLNDRMAFRAWALSIARNLVFNGRRNNHLVYGDLHESESLDRDPLESMVRDETSLLIRSNIERLSPILREVIQLRVVQELSYKEIAAVTGATEDVVKIRLYRARRTLVQRLQRSGDNSI